nr:hypothetical protein [Kibdelosporangium sp. MJ126-NF4]
MALLVFYKRIREDTIQVEYQFGTTDDNLDRNLVIDKRTREFRSTNSPVDGLLRAATGRILGRVRSDGAWPEGGIIQS